MDEVGPIDVFVGVDVGKGAHHVVALGAGGEVLVDRPLPQDEKALRELVRSLADGGRQVLLVVDQPATVGALVVAVATDEGVRVGYLPGLAMRRIADLHPGEAKTDARDAMVIAHAARSLPHALRSLRSDDEQTAHIAVLAGFDEDLNKQAVSVMTRLRGVLTQIHPALERAVGPQVDHHGVLDLLAKYPTPQRMRQAGRSRLAQAVRKRSPRLAERTAEDVVTALGEQTVVVTGTEAYGTVVKALAGQLSALLEQRAAVARELEELVERHPLSQVLTSMPGVGFRTAARIVTETSGRHFPSSGHLAAYAGLAPVTRRSGSSIRGERQPRNGNKRLKRILYLSAFASLRDPASRAYYDRKRAEGKSHKQALLALARRRCDVIHALLRDRTTYDPERASAA